jgi:SsrA-binding protein
MCRRRRRVSTLFAAKLKSPEGPAAGGGTFRRNFWSYNGRMAGRTKLISENRRARHDYHLLERFEAGLALRGTEVKALRERGASLQRAFADVRDGEIWLVGAHIPEYAQGNIANHDPDRDRKLLLHRREIDSLVGKVRERGLTLVPTRLYFKDGRAKVELALARGKEARDKRRDIAERDARRQIERELKSRRS